MTLTDSERVLLESKARLSRLETVRLARIAGAGHYTSAFSAAELFAVLYYRQLRIDPKNPHWPERDRFILSKGHAAIGLYPLLADIGFFEPALLDNYTRMGSAFGDHPDMRKIPGIDFSSGSLGHGLSVGLGMALAARLAGSDYQTWVMVGDGELAEGQIWEAIMAASHFQVANLICLVDRNQLSIDGNTEDVMAVEPLAERFDAFGWSAERIDGHDLDEIAHAFARIDRRMVGRPRAIIADTVKGKGVAMMEGNLDWHVGNLGPDEYEAVMAELSAGAS